VVKKTMVIRIPIETYNVIQNKKAKMEKIIERTTGKKRLVPLTRVVKIMVDKPLYLGDEEVYNLSRKKTKCKKY